MGGVTEVQEAGDICILMGDSYCCMQKPTQHSNTTMLRLKLIFLNAKKIIFKMEIKKF